LPSYAITALIVAFALFMEMLLDTTAFIVPVFQFSGRSEFLYRLPRLPPPDDGRRLSEFRARVNPSQAA
jgi:hypothetical protein